MFGQRPNSVKVHFVFFLLLQFIVLQKKPNYRTDGQRDRDCEMREYK